MLQRFQAVHLALCLTVAPPERNRGSYCRRITLHAFGKVPKLSGNVVVHRVVEPVRQGVTDTVIRGGEPLLANFFCQLRRVAASGAISSMNWHHVRVAGRRGGHAPSQ